VTILRDEFMAAKQVVPQDLLGRIAVLKCEAQDAGGTTTTTTTKPKTPRANGKAAKADVKPEETKPAETAPTTTTTSRVTTIAPATERDLAPGAVEEPAADPAPEPEGAGDDEGFGETAAPADALSAALEFVIDPAALGHQDYVGRKLSSMTAKEVNTLHEKWYLKFKEAIDKTPIKAKLRDALLIVKAEWDKQAAAAK
jgi:hypothetical protein